MAIGILDWWNTGCHIVGHSHALADFVHGHVPVHYHCVAGGVGLFWIRKAAGWVVVCCMLGMKGPFVVVEQQRVPCSVWKDTVPLVAQKSC